MKKSMKKKEGNANSVWKMLSRNKTALIGLVIVLMVIAMALFAPCISPYDPDAMDLSYMFSKPGTAGHLLGTDEFGRDLLSRMIYGARVSIAVAFGGTIVGGGLGIILGLISGFKGGVIDSVIMRFIDGMFAFPFVLLAIVLMTVLGSGLRNVILAIGIANIPGCARLVRGQVHVVKNEEYCKAIEALGGSEWRLLFHHILPNILSPVIVFITLNIASAIISEAALSFLGLGIQPPQASWGNILRAGKDYLNTAPHIATISGLFILLSVLGFNLLGDGIRDVLDPRMKR
jgi:peptide/nickel transport system permease protein